MDPVYGLIRRRARRIVSMFPSARFYRDFPSATEQSRRCYETDPIVIRLRAEVAGCLEQNFGHGIKHAEKVTLDSGALASIECRREGYSKADTGRLILVAQCAGLLHDIKRSHKNHAVEGAACAKKMLQSYPLAAGEIDDVCRAIRNHEAFCKSTKIKTPEGLLVSNCLYDADKFRWGPDNFSDTIWDMVAFSETPFAEFMALYPKGMRFLENIKTTFRSPTGKRYGPQFIDMGLAIGRRLYRVIQTEFTDYL